MKKKPKLTLIQGGKSKSGSNKKNIEPELSEDDHNALQFFLNNALPAPEESISKIHEDIAEENARAKKHIEIILQERLKYIQEKYPEIQSIEHAIEKYPHLIELINSPPLDGSFIVLDD